MDSSFIFLPGSAIIDNLDAEGFVCLVNFILCFEGTVEPLEGSK